MISSRRRRRNSSPQSRSSEENSRWCVNDPLIHHLELQLSNTLCRRSAAEKRCLRATASGAAVEALIAGSVSHHERTALEADRRIAVFNIDERALLSRSLGCDCRTHQRRWRMDRQRRKRRLLHLYTESARFIYGQELRGEIPEDVIHD